MMIRKMLTAVLTATLLLGTVGSAAYAAEVPDLSQEGSITLTMTYNEKAVAGGQMTLYRVGDILEDDGNYSFVLTDEFAASNADLEDIDSSEVASDLSDYVTKQGLTGTDKTIGSDGTVTFDGLKLGLYLLVQNKAASGYYAASPFLVSVPMYDEVNAVYVYGVTATPKVEVSKTSGNGGGGSSGGGSSSGGSSSSGGGGGATSSSSSGPGVSSGGSEGSSEGGSSGESGFSDPAAFIGERLPQTGQLNWPIPILVITGLLFFSAGWKLCQKENKECHEG
ncbi:MAG: hypothetical protein LUE86_14490 [Clostridiales bacterium]|nr:hypothetical protein [Clostridiales bacterium]